jgi:hypothetical protein
MLEFVETVAANGRIQAKKSCTEVKKALIEQHIESSMPEKHLGGTRR